MGWGGGEGGRRGTSGHSAPGRRPSGPQTGTVEGRGSAGAVERAARAAALALLAAACKPPARSGPPALRSRLACPRCLSRRSRSPKKHQLFRGAKEACPACLRERDPLLPHFGQRVAAVEHLLVEPAPRQAGMQGRLDSGFRAQAGAQWQAGRDAGAQGGRPRPSRGRGSAAGCSTAAAQALGAACGRRGGRLGGVPTAADPGQGAPTSARAPSRCAGGRCSGC